MNKRQSMKGMGADAFFASPARQHAGKTASQHSGDQNDAAHAESTKLVKATFYLTPAQILKLEQLRLDRLKKGQRIDKSALVREAIDQLTG